MIINPIILAAKTVGISPALLLAMCFQESSLRNTVTVSDGGSASWGVCQVKYTTAFELDSSIRPTHLLQPYTNALVAAKYMKKLIKRYGGNEMCAVNAYNTGPGKTRCTPQTLNTRYVRQITKHLKSRPWEKKRVI